MTTPEAAFDVDRVADPRRYTVAQRVVMWATYWWLDLRDRWEDWRCHRRRLRVAPRIDWISVRKHPVCNDLVVSIGTVRGDRYELFRFDPDEGDPDLYARLPAEVFLHLVDDFSDNYELMKLEPHEVRL